MPAGPALGVPGAPFLGRESVPSELMLLDRFGFRTATVIRLIGLGLIVWSVVASANRHPVTGGRSAVVIAALAAAVIAYLVWTAQPSQQTVTPDLYVMAAAGGLLIGASPNSGASAFVFVAVVVAGLRVELSRTVPLILVSILALALSVLIYKQSALGMLAYALGFSAGLLAASGRRQSVERAEQAELLLAQTQRSHEEQLRAARLEESTRIAREIHDVLAHALAGLTIQLEATSALIEQGADRDSILSRVQRAHDLAREGLRETSRAVGALRGDPVAAAAGIEGLVADYRSGGEAPIELTIDGDRDRLAGPTGQVVLRVAQEALTNVRKHAPGAAVSVVLHAGEEAADDVVLLIDNRCAASAPGSDGAADALASTGGGYGLKGMRERAQGLGGSLSAGATDEGWSVQLRLPSPAAVEEVK
jgi:signal transduction histidine kinase